jgi:GTP-binding protein HflX
MQQTSPGSESAILVSIDLGDADYNESLMELRLLAETAGVRTLATVEAKRQRPDAALFAGSGKVQEIAELVERMEVPLVIFNHELSPAQMRNLTTQLNTRVIDRTMLILDIFAQRAQSHEGKVQVELAQLKYLSTRLVGQNADMGQQKFAVGARGPGETQLELDRRKLDKRVHLLKERLVKLKSQRDVMRRSRDRSDVLSVSIVGYTNAGKSTLFNCSPPWIPPRAACMRKARARSWYRIRWASSAICRTAWWPHSAARWKKPYRPTCCCMWWMPAIPTMTTRSPK